MPWGWINVTLHRYLKRLITVSLFAIVTIFALPCTVSAGEGDKAAASDHKVVRVGWYESAFHHVDKFGRRSGYGYEYQKRIAIYTGWTYEYVEGSWSELLEKLIAGEIDLLSDVSYTDERAQQILYSSEAMGSEGYHVFITPDNKEIRPDDFSSLNGKRVCVNKNSIQEQMFVDWAGNHGVTPEIIESTDKSPVMLEKLAKGEFDALVTLDTYGNSADVIPVWKVGFAESFFGINKRRPDLKQELDLAMTRLFEDNRDFNLQLAEKLNKSSSVNRFLTAEELEWLDGHGTIRVGYRDDFLPFCDYDEETKSLTGYLTDYLRLARNAENNAELSFETKAFSTNEEALKALKEGDIDCIFPLSISSYDGEQLGVISTDPLVGTEMYAAVRTADRQGISLDLELKAAIKRGDPNYDAFLMDKFPNWHPVYYDDEKTAFRDVASGGIDTALLPNYRINHLSDLLDKYKLTALSTGQIMDIAFTVRQEDDCLYSILNKITGQISPETDNSILTRYSFRDEKLTLGEFIMENLIFFIVFVAVFAVIILLLVMRNHRIEAKAAEGRQIISKAERDPLTDLYNWNFFLVYAGRIHQEHPDKPMDAAVMNIDRFHSVNALQGREYGDRILCALADEIKVFLDETDGIASRFEADRFDIYCAHRDDWDKQYERFQAKLDTMFQKANIHLRMGVRPWQEGIDTVVQFDHARAACNSVRGDYTAGVVIYDDVMGHREERDQKLLNDLSRALKQHELEVYYQPKYGIQTPEPVLHSAEALVRWRHPELGLLTPGDFIPLFEQSGQISALDNYVWEEAARQIAEWKSDYGVSLPVSVNVSRVDVFDPALESKLDELVERYGIACSELKLEITESAYTENADQLIQVIGRLRAKGYKVEMDDFGSGYSSLNMLSSMPIDILKMDIAFIRNIEQSEKDFHLVELIIDIAQYLKVPVIAEGVENENQLRLLKDAGCDYVQGFYFSRPLPSDVFGKRILGGITSK